MKLPKNLPSALAVIFLTMQGPATEPGRLSAQTTDTIEFFAAGRLQTGLTLFHSNHEIVVLGRDGWMHSLDPRKPESQIRSHGRSYHAFTATELRGELIAEFGKSFEVKATQHFLVVQPTGRGDQWPRLFEQSHRAFIRYVSERNVDVQKGRFPMVAIVFPDERAMYRELEKQNLQIQRVAGLYSGHSNRVITHDGGQASQFPVTLRHEAAHQSAFNSGVHSRVNDTPRWITEGLGQLFEPSAMIRPPGGARSIDRINQDSLRRLKQTFFQNPVRDTDLSQTVMQLISDDSMFENPKQIDDAYAVSWAMMFFLAERDCEAFAGILDHTAKRPPFQPYPRADRLRDFQKICGMDPHEFSQHLSRLIRSN